ncbi:hypothetical protein pipiens_009247 [Culex pipiens pipiens]|uniref:ZAD domain-containing protein n=1 Tax=Culex pipiens pipiens TaxID=38569 RepID=A0ABD1DEH6_CULPP
MDSAGPTTQRYFNSSKLRRFKHGSTDQLVAENVTHGSDGVFRCAIAGPGSCPFALPKMIQFTFACHFLRSHPKEAEEKGFLEEARAPPKSQPASLGHFVVRTERGFCCRIDPSQTCPYVQEDQVSAQNFTRHFRLAHPALARKHGFYQVLQSDEGRSILNTMVQRSVEKSTADDSEPTSQKRKLTEDDDDSGESSSDVIVLNPGDENEWMNTPSDDPSEYCRLCFSVARRSKAIFSGPQDTGSSCAALIEECTGVRLAAGEDYPAAICHECSEKLNDIKCFRTVCETLNRVVCRNRATSRSKTPEAVAPPSSPPPLVPIETPAANLTCDEELTLENEDDDEDYVVQLSDSDDDDEEEVVDDAPQESSSTAVEEAGGEDLPYIALQDDWFCCKQCNQIHHTLDVMVDHLHNYHSELGFFVKAKPAAPQVNKKKYKKSKPRTIATPVEYQEVVIADKKYFKCNDCDTLVSQKSNMARHERCYHKEGSELKPRLYCRVAECYQNFMDRMGLTRHLKLQHSYESIEEAMTLQLHHEVEIL